ALDHRHPHPVHLQIDVAAGGKSRDAHSYCSLLFSRLGPLAAGSPSHRLGQNPPPQPAAGLLPSLWSSLPCSGIRRLYVLTPRSPRGRVAFPPSRTKPAAATGGWAFALALLQAPLLGDSALIPLYGQSARSG